MLSIFKKRQPQPPVTKLYNAGLDPRPHLKWCIVSYYIQFSTILKSMESCLWNDAINNYFRVDNPLTPKYSFQTGQTYKYRDGHSETKISFAIRIVFFITSYKRQHSTDIKMKNYHNKIYLYDFYLNISVIRCYIHMFF